MELVNKKVLEVVRENGKPSSVKLEDGTVLMVSEVIEPPSAIDKLMRGMEITLKVNGSLAETRLHHGFLLCELHGEKFYVSPWGSIEILTSDDKIVNLEELRKRVAKREHERLLPWIEDGKPDINKEWWIPKEHGIPELESGVEYSYIDDERRFNIMKGGLFSEINGRLFDSYRDEVFAIFELPELKVSS